MWIFQGRINRKKQGILKGKKQEVQKVRKWLRRKSTRLCLSLLSGLLAVGIAENTGNMKDIGNPVNMKNEKDIHRTVAWWGLLYPDFCRIPAEESKEEQDVEDTQPKYVFWIVEFIKNL